MNAVVAYRPSVCPSSRNRTRGNPPKEMSGCKNTNQQDELGLARDTAYSGGVGSGSDEKYESSIASIADGRACRFMCSNLSASAITSGGKSLEVNRTVRSGLHRRNMATYSDHSSAKTLSYSSAEGIKLYQGAASSSGQ